jgi:hypothetical protein
MGQGTTVVALSAQEMVRLEMIIIDKDKDDALAFLSELRIKIQATSIKGLKSHLDM